ncbi:MAG: hypothetical protein MH825_14500 [Cyanobacteria bacterium]|nr:hypothetical protein [Cyanobacteriota bacterium]
MALPWPVASTLGVDFALIKFRACRCDRPEDIPFIADPQGLKGNWIPRDRPI